MRSRWFGLVLVAATVLSLSVPAAASANAFSMDWSIFGFEAVPPQRFETFIDGNDIFYRVSTGAPLRRFDLVTGQTHELPPAEGANVWSPVAAGNWVAWIDTYNVTAMNRKTGAIKHITNDPDWHTWQDTNASISDANGTYVVWQRAEPQGGVEVTRIKAKNLGINGSFFALVGAAGHPTRPTIYGKRVAYSADWNGARNVFVKTIGSSAAPRRITSFLPGDTSLIEESVNIGSHLVVWLGFTNGVGDTLHYYDFDTGGIRDAPLASSSVYKLGVSGDRILFMEGTVDDPDLRLWDSRVAKSAPQNAAFDVTTGFGDSGMIDGSRVVYRGGSDLYYARLAVPSISLNAVPKRIARGGHIHLSGSISDQGHRIGGATINIEKYAAGKWTLVKRMAATPTGTFTYKTPKTYSKTKYRIAYDGRMSAIEAPAGNHLSSVSVVKTAWPR